MSLVRLDDVSLAYGEQKLLVHVGFEIEPGERVCLIGRNGTGKTSLFRLITGIVQPDSGLIQYRNGLVMSTLDQALPENVEATVREVVAEGLADLKALVDEYERLAHQDLDKAGMKRLDDLQHRIDELDGWSIDQRVELMMTEMALPPDQPIGELSGGWRRRVGLAKALISKPDLLLLDEPTNHLDIVTIQWLENRIRSWPGAVLFITHDRAFLDKLATRICELDRGRLLSFPGSYDEYLERKEKLLEDEATANKLFDKKLDDEEIWIRQGVKARRHRNQNRVRRLEDLRQEYADRLTPLNRARISIEEADQSGRKVIEAKHVTHGFRGEELIKDFSCKIMRGRPHRPPRQQRRRQKHAAADPAGGNHSPARHDQDRHGPRNRLLRPAAGNPGSREERGLHRRQRQRLREDQRPRPARHRLPPGLPVQRQAGHDAR